MRTLEKKKPVGAEEILFAARSFLAAGESELATLSVMHSFAVEPKVEGRAALAAECVGAIPGIMLRAACRSAIVGASFDGIGVALLVYGLSELVDFVEGFSPSESLVSLALLVLSLVIFGIVIVTDVVAVLWLGLRIRMKDAALGKGVPRLVTHLAIASVAMIVQWVDVYLGQVERDSHVATILSTWLMMSTLCACCLTNSRAGVYSIVGLIGSILIYLRMLIGTSANRDLAYMAVFTVILCVWFNVKRTFPRLPMIERVRSGSLQAEGSDRP